MGVASADACQSAGASCGVVGSSLCIAPSLVANSKRVYATFRTTPVCVYRHDASFGLKKKANGQEQVLTAEPLQGSSYVVVLSPPFYFIPRQVPTLGSKLPSPTGIIYTSSHLYH